MIGRRKQAKRYKQGDPLPAVPCRLDEIPVGACVRVACDMVSPPGTEPFPVDAVWWIIAFRIGLDGPAHCRSMSVPPTDPAWSKMAGEEDVVIASDAEVIEACWPTRAPASYDTSSTDPVDRRG